MYSSDLFEGVDKITPKLMTEDGAVSGIPAATIRKLLEQHLASGVPAWNPYD